MKKQTILIIDDTPSNITILNALLRNDYNTIAAPSGLKGLELAQAQPRPDLILLDIMMPKMNGYEVFIQLKENPETAEIPVIFVTALDQADSEEKGLLLGAVDYIIKPFSPAIVKARVATHLSLKNMRDHLGDLVAERTRELQLTQDATILCMASLAETRDNETGNHIRRTQHYVRLMAEHLQLGVYHDLLTPENVHLLHASAPLHDIGKIGIPDIVLLKPSRLTSDEFKLMCTHTTLGRNAIMGAATMLGHNSFLRFAGDIAHTHHEKWDGSGYPQGLKGEAIPLCGRIMAVADIYDALISKRIYKPPFPHSKAVQIITQGDGRTMPDHFDPVILQAFADLHEQFREIALAHIDDPEERQTLNQ